MAKGIQCATVGTSERTTSFAHNNALTTSSTMFYVCRMTDSFQWEGLRSTTDEDYADQLAEFYSNQYPHAYIDVLTYEEFHGGPDKWAAMAIN